MDKQIPKPSKPPRRFNPGDRVKLSNRRGVTTHYPGATGTLVKYYNDAEVVLKTVGYTPLHHNVAIVRLDDSNIPYGDTDGYIIDDARLEAEFRFRSGDRVICHSLDDQEATFVRYASDEDRKKFPGSYVPGRDDLLCLVILDRLPKVQTLGSLDGTFIFEGSLDSAPDEELVEFRAVLQKWCLPRDMPQ